MRSAPQILAWAGVLLVSLWLIFAGGTYFGIARTVPKAVSFVLLASVLIGWLAVAARHPSWRPSTRLAIPIAIALAAYVAATATAIVPRLAIESLTVATAFVLIYLFLVRLLAHPWFAARVRTLTIAIVTVTAVGYLAQVLTLWIDLWRAVGTVFLPTLRPGNAGLWFGAPTVVAGFLMTLAPTAIAWAWSSTRARRLLGVILVLTSSVAVILTGARAAWLGVVVGAVAVVVPLSVNGALAALITHRRRAIVVGCIAAAVAIIALPLLAARLTTSGLELRTPLWATALEAFREDPVTGIGPANWPLWNVERVPADQLNLVLPHAHNLFLQALGEFGVGAIVAAVALLFGIGRLCLRRWQANVGDDRRIVAATIFVSAALMASQLVDNFSNLPLIVIAAMLPVADLDARSAVHAGPVRRSMIGVIACVGAGTAVLLAQIPWQVASLHAAAARSAASAGDERVAVIELQAAAALDPDLPLYAFEEAIAMARSGAPLEAQAALLDRALLVDHQAQVHLARAALALRVGDEADALRHARLALERAGAPEPRRAPSDGVIALNVGSIADRLGQHALAVDAYARAVAVDPTILRSDYWRRAMDTAERAAVVAAAAELVRRSSRFSLLSEASIWLEAGERAAAQAVLDQVPPGAERDALQAAISFADRPDQLRRRLEEIGSLAPTDPLVPELLARLGLVTSDRDLYHRSVDWLTALGSNPYGFAGSIRAQIPAAANQAVYSSQEDAILSIYQREPLPELLPPGALTTGQLVPDRFLP